MGFNSGFKVLNRRGASVHSTTGSRAVHISLQGLYCTCKPVFCSHVTLTGYPLHSLVSPSFLLPCVTVCHHISTGLYFSLALLSFLILCVSNTFINVSLSQFRYFVLYNNFSLQGPAAKLAKTRDPPFESLLSNPWWTMGIVIFWLWRYILWRD